MSSYICFHLKRKGVEKKDFFLSYCRLNKIYQCFKDCGIPFYCNDPEPFAEITEKMLNDILNEICKICKSRLFILVYSHIYLLDKRRNHLVQLLIDDLDFRLVDDIIQSRVLLEEILHHVI